MYTVYIEKVHKHQMFFLFNIDSKNYRLIHDLVNFFLFLIQSKVLCFSSNH